MQQENCPYCGVYLSPLEEDGKTKDGLFTPPYKVVEEEAIPTAPYSSEEKQRSIQEPIEELKIQEQKRDVTNGANIILLPLTFLISGAVLLLFSLALFLFSRNGILTLRWDGTYWIAYLLIALGCLCAGSYYLNRVDE